MGVLTVIFLGCAALLSASSSADSNQTQTEAVDQENSLLRILAAAVDNKKDQKDVPERVEDINCIALTNTGKGEDALDIPEQSDDGLTKKQGCEGHQKEEQWGSSDHDNCICQAPDRLCYHVDCLPGSEIVRDSDGIWSCDVTSYKRDITGSAVAMHERIKRFTGLEIFGLATGIFGVVASIIGFTVDRIESAQTTAQLNEIQDQIRELDRKVDELTQMVSDLQLGQEYLRQAILYARDELRLRNIMETHAAMQIRDGQYVLPGHNIQDWADSVLSHGSDGVDQIENQAAPISDFVAQGHTSLDNHYSRELVHW
ncbi:uncharacterized protein LOC118420144 [Branchiostoma floridae]|uniref:Uncharacterized protein LOC118420144 n=1 Tax=Branchiostoma floridae TaxID=7739 RepID=A0A9J7MXS9_BRAFL|nr:uncharacterized protein LOC118420144 [Branchiostoma floridae]